MIKKGEKIPVSLLQELKSRLERKKEREGKLTPQERRLYRRVVLALTLKRLGK
ncbi:MAG: hypothetical protein NZ608_07060 [candidate division WOR-3 bacterium]|nr:hypothetical protein [candidate division WOR-3 bacterium]